MFRNRSVVEIMVLVFTLVIASAIIMVGATVAWIEIKEPARDTTSAVQALFSLMSGIVGALLGLLAGKSESVSGLGSRPVETPEQ
jgi:uncharacterized metal-binding protein